MPDSMTFTYTPTQDDYIKVFRAYSWLNSESRSRLIVVGVASLLAFCGLLLIATGFHWFLLLSLLAPIFFFLLLFIIFPETTGRRIIRNERMSCEMAWTASEDGYLITTKFAELKSDWGAFDQFIESKEHFILIHSTNHRIFNFVPKRAFESAESLSAFRQILQVRLQKPPRRSAKS